ncbi:class I SAM-dependent methyltransferase [Desulfobulbus rhabdoformis]|uniref:class I SAM-dependent methyltransferase n=1 Tax=Desulfobulbus rhabdoformis TaxID=34032 RepID=UPI001962ABEB|nr:class I SAM-dependent methyltransferase [Desulfobulbus rhabdoformis]MBM9616862.1 class I SAM-dependent methyltransferase [Desulfobulbus rhabdoformis]
MEQSIIDGYAEDADFLIASFEAISSSDVLSCVTEFIPRSPCQIIEIGSGTGRDAAWLAAKGHRVLAVEPVSLFLEAGRELHQSPHIKWLNDSLPSLSRVIQRNEKYDLALLVSVWQHVPKEEKFESLKNIRFLVRRSGMLIISIRNGPGSSKRECYPTSVQETVNIARQCGFRFIASREAQSVQKSNQRAKVTWSWLVFTLNP